MSILRVKRHRRFSPSVPSSIISCRVCGCTEDDREDCIAKTGWQCTWFEQDLCSACVPKIFLAIRVGAAHLFLREGLARSLCNFFSADIEVDQEMVLFSPDDLEPGQNGCRRCFTVARGLIGALGKGGGL